MLGSDHLLHGFLQKPGLDLPKFWMIFMLDVSREPLLLLDWIPESVEQVICRWESMQKSYPREVQDTGSSPTCRMKWETSTVYKTEDQRKSLWATPVGPDGIACFHAWLKDFSYLVRRSMGDVVCFRSVTSKLFSALNALQHRILMHKTYKW